VNGLDLHPRFENAQVGVISDGLGRFIVTFPAGDDVAPFAASYVNQTVSISW
jgi:hypothetical protein